jgi:hypothetical protein
VTANGFHHLSSLIDWIALGARLKRSLGPNLKFVGKVSVHDRAIEVGRWHMSFIIFILALQVTVQDQKYLFCDQRLNAAKMSELEEQTYQHSSILRESHELDGKWLGMKMLRKSDSFLEK